MRHSPLIISRLSALISVTPMIKGTETESFKTLVELESLRGELLTW